MAKRSLSEQLDAAVEAIMRKPEAPVPEISPQLAAVLRVAADLRDLPTSEFKTRLKAALLSAPRGVAAPVANYGKALLTFDDIVARLEEMAAAPKLAVYDVRAALDDLPEMAMRFFTALNQCTVGVSRFSAQTPHWERHPAGDELLYILDGAAEVTTLTDDGPVLTPVRAGEVFVCPQGLWHWPRPKPSLTMLFATPGEGIEHSQAADPRLPGRGSAATHQEADVVPGHDAPTFKAHDLRAALESVPELAISAATTEVEANASFRALTSLNQCTLGVTRFSGLTPWERHPDGDELLYALDGAVDLAVLTDDGPVHTTVPAGSVFICPRGLWHRQRALPSVALLYGTATQTTEISFADDPRRGGT